ncbi:hypothetical protein C8J56DRAFT_1026478 [Mycena floridula]|nr:hypothetical protein C8J56DRAFT_1026478 [Mycena floridula]
MPSLSLVRRFGKQRKHGGHTISESANLQIMQDFPAANASSGSTVNNSHGLLSESVALSQHMEGVSIRNITGPVMSNNHVHIINNYGSQTNFENSDFAILRAGDIYLEEEIESYLDVNNVWRTRYKGQTVASSMLNMSIWRYRGERAVEVQLTHLTALVFHGAPYFMNRREYYKSLPSSQWMTHYLKLHAGGPQLARRPTGYSFDPQICRAFETNTFIKEDLLAYYEFLFDMMSMSCYHSLTLPHAFDKAAPFQLSHPEIKLPVYSLRGWNKLVSSVNEMNTNMEETGIMLAVLPNMTIRLEGSIDDSARCRIPTPQIPTFSISQGIELFQQSNHTLFATWACQANHLIHDLLIKFVDIQTGKLLRLSELWENWTNFSCHAQYNENRQKDAQSLLVTELLETKYLYLFCPWDDLAKAHWSRDEQGQQIIQDSSIQAAFGVIIDWEWKTYVYRIPPQFYQILQTIHESCGFDPYSTQVAEYLSLPLAVIDGGHSGLEEYFNADVEDPAYTSESESRDSDYVSASDDA